MNYEVTATVTVRVEVNDQNVIDRCVNDEDGWRTRMFYRDCDSPEAVAKHLAHNCIYNGSNDLRTLDGWADLPAGAATMTITDIDFDDVWVPA